jgi:hypothetical protein
MSNNDNSEKLANLNSLLEEMLIDAKQMTNDLTEGVINTRISSILGFTIAGIQLLILRENLYRGPLFILVWTIGFASIFYHSLLLYRKYETLKNRYSRFFEIRDELESM